MATDALAAFEPRKKPVQARATATVDAISEATIQILLGVGAERLTTTRVAERAGVSVGTLYQYFPNKQSLLFAVLEDHLDKVASTIEAACEQASHGPLAGMIRQVVEAYVDIKLRRMDMSAALYQVAADIGGPSLMKGVTRRMRRAIGAMLLTASDVELPPDKFAIDLMLAAIAGAMRSALEARASAAMFRKLREHLVLLCQTYMEAVTARHLKQTGHARGARTRSVSF
jgi:AcrR family transcriptional regulator